jgi:hypothetical protein
MEAGVQNGRFEEGVAPAAHGPVDVLLARFPGPVRLYADKRFVQYLLGLFAAMAFVLGRGLFLGTDPKHFTVELIVFITLLWPIGSIVLIVLSRNALALDLDRDGFTVNGYAWYGARRHLWSEVGAFGTRSFRFMTFGSYQDQAAGRQRFFPDTYGLRADGLARLMNEWRRRALAQQT